MDDVYQNIDDYNPSRKRKTLIAFDDMIADIMSNKEFQAIIKELIIRRKNSVPKDLRLNSTHYLIMKISNRK